MIVAGLIDNVRNGYRMFRSNKFSIVPKSNRLVRTVTIPISRSSPNEGTSKVLKTTQQTPERQNTFVSITFQTLIGQNTVNVNCLLCCF